MTLELGDEFLKNDKQPLTWLLLTGISLEQLLIPQVVSLWDKKQLRGTTNQDKLSQGVRKSWKNNKKNIYLKREEDEIGWNKSTFGLTRVEGTVIRGLESNKVTWKNMKKSEQESRRDCNQTTIIHVMQSSSPFACNVFLPGLFFLATLVTRDSRPFRSLCLSSCKEWV